MTKLSDLLKQREASETSKPKPISLPKPRSQKPKIKKNIHELTEENLLNFVKAKGKIKLYECFWFFLPESSKNIEALLYKLLNKNQLKKDSNGWFEWKGLNNSNDSY